MDIPDFFSNDFNAAQLPNSEADNMHESTSSLGELEPHPAAGTVHLGLTHRLLFTLLL